MPRVPIHDQLQLKCGLAATQTRGKCAGDCKGKASNIIEENGGLCPDNCFDSAASQATLSPGAPGSGAVVSINQCIKVVLSLL